MDSFSKKAVLLSLRQMNMDYNKNGITVYEIEIFNDEDKIIRIYSSSNDGYHACEFGVSYEKRSGKIHSLSGSIDSLLIYGGGTRTANFIENYLYFSIRTPSVIYELIKHFNNYIFNKYRYKCKDVVILICKKMLKIILKDNLKLRMKERQKLSEKYINGFNYSIELVSFIEDVFRLLQFDKPFEISVKID